MGRYYMGGAETEVGNGTNTVEGSLTTTGVGAAVARDATVKRTGEASWKFTSGTSGTAIISAFNSVQLAGFGWSANTDYFFRYAFRFDSGRLPSTETLIAQGGAQGGTGGFSLRVDSSLNLLLKNEYSGNLHYVGSAFALAADTWYVVEVRVRIDASSHVSELEARVDGNAWASETGQTSGTPSTIISFGWCSSPGSLSTIMWVDDVMVNDSAGSVNNSWCGATGGLLLMKPISDNARGNWTAGAGGTTNLWDAVNNSPPVGVADGSATNTSQIKIKSTSLPSSCDLNLDTYLNAGVPSGATINAVLLVVNHGEDPATGTKAGTAAVVSNPSSGTVSFNFGADLGLQGTYVGNWRWDYKLVEAPTVTLSTAPVIRVTCTSGSTGTRAASCDFLGMYVDYTPAAAGSLIVPRDAGRDRYGLRRR